MNSAEVNESNSGARKQIKLSSQSENSYYPFLSSLIKKRKCVWFFLLTSYNTPFIYFFNLSFISLFYFPIFYVTYTIAPRSFIYHKAAELAQHLMCFGLPSSLLKKLELIKGYSPLIRTFVKTFIAYFLLLLLQKLWRWRHQF